jgi:hypothetical protein
VFRRCLLGLGRTEARATYDDTDPASPRPASPPSAMAIQKPHDKIIRITPDLELR